MEAGREITCVVSICAPLIFFLGGGQPETVYEPTSKFDIDSAFYDVSFPEPEEG